MDKEKGRILSNLTKWPKRSYELTNAGHKGTNIRRLRNGKDTKWPDNIYAFYIDLHVWYKENMLVFEIANNIV